MALKFKKPKFKKTIARLTELSKVDVRRVLEKYGGLGVAALSRATPQDTGEAASSWDFSLLEQKDGYYRLSWTNSKMAGRTPLVILIQYGHGTRNGGYVPGIDFINPALKPIFEGLKRELFLEVMR